MPTATGPAQMARPERIPANMSDTLPDRSLLSFELDERNGRSAGDQRDLCPADWCVQCGQPTLPQMDDDVRHVHLVCKR